LVALPNPCEMAACRSVAKGVRNAETGIMGQG
jgi:hypothetical protein